MSQGAASIWTKRRKRLISLFVAILSGTALISCSALPGGARIYSSTQGQTPSQLPGIGNGEADVYVLYVHGMGATETNFFKGLIESGLKHLPNAKRTKNDHFEDNSCGQECRTVALPEPVYVRGEALTCTPKTPQDTPCLLRNMGTLQKTTISTGQRDIHTYSYYWDDAADAIQRLYSYTDEQLPGDARRPLINRWLKRRIITEGFSDATLYVGPFGKTMRRGLETAMCQMLRDALGKQQKEKCFLGKFTSSEQNTIAELPLVFAAKSLGSRYLLDTLLPSDQLDVLATSHSEAEIQEAIAEVAVKKSVAASISNMYLMANQLPLLGLGGVRADSRSTIAKRDQAYCSHIAPKVSGDDEKCFAPLDTDDGLFLDHIGIFNFASDARVEFGVEDRKINVYAYHDPSDLLGYKAGQHFTEAARKNVEFVEIVHRNAYQWFGLFASPLSAHANEDIRKQASKIIWCGSVVKSDGGLEANEC